MQEPDWTRVGAWAGGAVQSIALSPHFESDRLALAATSAGLFRSTNGGLTWQRTGDLGYVATRCVAFDPGGAVLAATQAGALARSTDGGAQWHTLATWGFGPINAFAFAKDQDGRPVIFAATDEGIYRSMDDGASWQSAAFGLLDVEILCLACAPDDSTSAVAGEVALAGSAGGGLYRSRNAGRAWREMGHGLPDTAVQCVAVTPAGTFAGTEAGLFRLADGEVWSPCGLDGAAVNCLVACNGTLLAGTTHGVFRADGAMHWQPVGPDEPVLAMACAANGVVFCGTTHNGIWISDDGGHTWRTAHEGLAAHAPPLAAFAGRGALLLADALGGAAHSDDGATWHPIRTDDVIVCATASPTSRRPTLMAATERQLLLWDAGRLSPLPTQPPLDGDDAITTLALTGDGVCLIGTQAGRCKVGGAGLPWHDVVLSGTGAIVSLHLAPTGSLFALRVGSARADDAGSFSAELWCLPTLVLPHTDETAWQMLMALDGLRTPLACLSVESRRIVIAAQNTIAQAYLDAGHPMEVRRINVESGIAFTAVAARSRETYLASNRGVIRLSESGAYRPLGRALRDLPVVALLVGDAALWAVTLGGEVWRYPQA